MQACKLLLKDLRTFSRWRALRHQHKVLQDVSVPPAEYMTDDKGNIFGPKPTGYPAGLEVDPAVDRIIDDDPAKGHRKHPGVMHSRTIHLPELLRDNANLTLTEHSHFNNDKFASDVKRMRNIFVCRQPPVTARERKTRFKGIVQATAQVYDAALAESEEELTEKQLEAISREVTQVSHIAYNKTTHNWKPIKYTDYTGLVYMAAKLASNYAVLLKIFNEIQQRDQQFVPGSVYNLGSGTGSVIWAANGVWHDQVLEYYCVDNSRYMRDLALRLLSKDPKDPFSSCVSGVHFRQFPPSDKVQFKLVVSAYLLMDQPSWKHRLEIVSALWKQTEDYLVLVEQGTNPGYRLIMEARDQIFKMMDKDTHMEGHVFAPCPHDEVCPKLEYLKTPCTFPVDYKRLNTFTDYGQGIRTESERFSYLVMKKGKRDADGVTYPRIMELLHRHKHSHCRVCCPDGTDRQFIISRPKPNRNLYKCVRKSEEGDLLPVLWPKKDAH